MESSLLVGAESSSSDANTTTGEINQFLYAQLQFNSVIPAPGDQDDLNANAEFIRMADSFIEATRYSRETAVKALNCRVHRNSLSH